MTGRGRGRSVRAGGRGATASASSPARRVTRQQNHNIDPSLSGETPINIDASGAQQFVGQTSDDLGSERIASQSNNMNNGLETIAAASTRALVLSSIPEHSDSIQNSKATKLKRKFLDRLLKSSDEVFDYLSASQDPDDELWSDELDALVDAAQVYRQHFVSDAETVFLDRDLVLGKVGAEPDTKLWVDTTKTVLAINLRQLLENIVSIQRGAEVSLVEELGFWDTCFPTSFIPEDEDLVDPINTFEQALNIRTQSFLAVLEAAPDVDPLAELAKAFCRDDVSLDLLQNPVENEELLGELKPIPTFDLSPGTENRVRVITRLGALVGRLAEPESLRGDFPFDDFLRDLQSYVQDMYMRVKASLRHQGTLPAPRFDASSGMLSGATYVPDYSGTAPQSVQPTSSYPPLSQHYGGQPGSMYATATAAVAASQKRSAPEDEDEDEGAFETDTRSAKAKGKRVVKPRTKRPRTGEGSALELYNQSSLPEPDLAALTQRSREIAAANRKPKEPQTRTPWSQRDTRILIRAIDAYKCKWSALAKDIQSGQIIFDHNRNQQALRDKARILKQDYLRTDGVLPPSFDLVVLGKKEVENIKSVGRNPYRKEADFVDGQPVNTLLQPGGLEDRDEEYTQLDTAAELVRSIAGEPSSAHAGLGLME